MSAAHGRRRQRIPHQRPLLGVQALGLAAARRRSSQASGAATAGSGADDDGVAISAASSAGKMCPPTPDSAAKRRKTKQASAHLRAPKQAFMYELDALPEDHRSAVNWNYVKPVAPTRACQAIGVTMAALAQLVVDSRQMLINRRA